MTEHAPTRPSPAPAEPAPTGLGAAFQRGAAGFRAFADCTRPPLWTPGELVAEQQLTLPFAAATLSYGFGVMEGLKAEQAADGRILLFRLADHGRRFRRSAELLLLPPFPLEAFVEGVASLVHANRSQLPVAGRGSLYIRPVEFAQEEMLGLRTPNRAAVLVYASPTGPMASTALQLEALDLPRAAPGGAAAAKAIANYASALRHKEAARGRGFDDVLFSSAEGLVQETLGTNVFCVVGSGQLATPALDGCFLGGITRDSVITLARARGIDVVERALPLDEVLSDGRELFCTGTATGVRSVARLCHGERERSFGDGGMARELGAALAAIKSGAADDPHTWTTSVPR